MYQLFFLFILRFEPQSYFKSFFTENLKFAYSVFCNPTVFVYYCNTVSLFHICQFQQDFLCSLIFIMNLSLAGSLSISDFSGNFQSQVSYKGVPYKKLTCMKHLFTVC
jgi:hypothetical protein